MDSCRCCRWIRLLSLPVFLALFSLPSSAYESAYGNGTSSMNPAERFVSWFEPKLRSALSESEGIVADRLPVKLAMAQAALESGWGKSKAAVKRKNFFGLMRSDGTPMSFRSPEESIRFYIKTLSEHKAYSGLRSRLGKTDSPDALVHELGSYSEHPEYPKLLKSIMRSIRLTHSDTTPDEEVPTLAHKADASEPAPSRYDIRSASDPQGEKLELRLDRGIAI